MTTYRSAELAQEEWAHIQDVQRTLGTEHGQRVLARLEQDFCGPTFHATNQKIQDFKEGERHVVQVLKTRFAMTLDAVLHANATTAQTDGDNDAT